MAGKDYKALKKKPRSSAKPTGISEKIIRVLKAYTLIAQNRCPTVADLMNRFDVTERTVRRYLANVDRIDPIELDRACGGYRFVNGGRIKKVQLSDEDFLMLITIGETVAHLGDPLKKSFQRFADKLTDISTKPIGKKPQMLIKIPDAFGAGGLTDSFNEIMQAIDENRSVDVTYHALHSGKSNDRRIDPYGFVFHEGTWALLGYCHLREGIRTFALDRIEKLKLTNFIFKPRDGFDLKQHLSASWGVRDDKPVEVVVRLSAKVASYITRRDKWHPSEERKILPT